MVTLAWQSTIGLIVRKVSHHLVGHCDCCGGYRRLGYYDAELGYLCFRCRDHALVADIELNVGGYELCRPKPSDKDVPTG
jgi:hypothetical protein